MGAWDFQQMLAVQPLGTVNQFPVQIRIIQKSPERHIRVIGTLMFIKAQCFVNQKWNIIFVFHVNDIFQSCVLQIIRIGIWGMIYRIIKTQCIFPVFTKQFSKYGILVFFIYMNVIICFCHWLSGFLSLKSFVYLPIL